jgi:hypothetical protein
MESDRAVVKQIILIGYSLQVISPQHPIAYIGAFFCPYSKFFHNN